MVSPEFRDWQSRQNWPSEMSTEYIEARKKSQYAPSFTSIGKMRDLALIAAGLYSIPGLALMVYAVYFE